MTVSTTSNRIPHAPPLLLIKASATYFVIVFGIAFFLGAFRIGVLVPLIGELPAVCIELPIILTVSWKATVWTVQRLEVSPNAFDRITMGFLAFVWLMLAEFTLSVVAFGKTPAEFVHELTSNPSHLLGLIGQIVYGWMPLSEANLWRIEHTTSTKAK